MRSQIIQYPLHRLCAPKPALRPSFDLYLKVFPSFTLTGCWPFLLLPPKILLYRIFTFSTSEPPFQIMDTVKPPPDDPITAGEHSPPRSQTTSGDDLLRLQVEHDSLVAEIESDGESHQILLSASAEKDERNDVALSENEQLVKALAEAESEREALRDELDRIKASTIEREDELARKINDEVQEGEKISRQLEEASSERDALCDELDRIKALAREREEELVKRSNEEMRERERINSQLVESKERIRVFVEKFESVKACLVRLLESLGEDKVENGTDEAEELELEGELGAILGEMSALLKLANVVEVKVREFEEMRKKEKRELENSVVSLTEENRDINSLLRAALVEKEAVEKSLSRIKGGGDQKRVAILQIAERGLQKVGFGFMRGAGGNEAAVDNSGASTGSRSDGSEGEEEAVTLASTVERIMKNLRLEITQLRRSLEESRSDTERLQCLTEKQAQQLAENAMYIKGLEVRETMLAQNVEEFLAEIKETEEEVARWRGACEMEVEAGNSIVEERDKVIAILKQELEKTKAALDVSNGKLKLKEELAAAAMAAQAASERSLQLADNRASELRERIEELTRQLEEIEKRERGNRRRVRHICWPWRVLKFSSAHSTNTTVRNVRRMLPEMQALLH
ncbi:hypothetical protein RJ639_030081 [Escallonia herrerae]|uniref:Uncharacterized protein n=1 Tax=Escallonia herrerae TaxID=1293975 RepID=A0AA88WZK2_9ASTE|nr:hypothetical protein RJ639_030081 [Escallonia herrerae]